MMDAASWFSVVNVALVAAGLAVGLAVGFPLGRRSSPAVAEAKKLREELDRAGRDHDSYKTSVKDHFRKTADLVGNMTRSYAAVYDHLSAGARSLCEEGAGSVRVPFGPLPEALASPVIEAGSEDGASPEPAQANAISLGAEPALVGDGIDDLDFGIEASSDSEAMDIGLEAAMHAAEDYAEATGPEAGSSASSKSAPHAAG